MSKLGTRPSVVVFLFAIGAALPAHAHFKLLAPTSWVNETSAGGPQKGKPCGPGATGIGGDDVQPVPVSNMVTTVHAGDTIKVDIQETVNHPGYFRVSLAENRDEFEDPPLTNTTSCAVDLNAVSMNSHGNVILDGIAETSAAGANRHIMQDVKIPDQPCDKCTLQVVQVMKDHGPPNCFYYHCADLKILPAEGSGTAGAAAGGSGGSSAGSGAAAGSTATAGSSSTPTPTPTAGSSGSAAASGGAGAVAGAAGRGAAGTGAAGVSATAGASAGSSSAAGSLAAGTAAPAAASNDSGCSVSTPRSSGAAPTRGAALLVLAGLFGLRARRRRARGRTPCPE